MNLTFFSGTKETLRLTKEMADVGAGAVVVATPSFFKNRMNYDAMMKHYTTVMELYSRCNLMF